MNSLPMKKVLRDISKEVSEIDPTHIAELMIQLGTLKGQLAQLEERCKTEEKTAKREKPRDMEYREQVLAPIRQQRMEVVVAIEEVSAIIFAAKFLFDYWKQAQMEDRLSL